MPLTTSNFEEIANRFLGKKTMENDAATLYCPNEHCQAINPLSHKFCQRCSTPLPKRYLWAVTADNFSLGRSGELLNNRYLIVKGRILLDTKPADLPQTPAPEKLQALRPYLRLISYRLHLPQVYGVLNLSQPEHQQEEILLLEKAPLQIDRSIPLEVDLCQQLLVAWQDATSMRQLNWLWQIAHMWQPLASEGVACSLLAPELLRVEGSLVRLLELRAAGDSKPELSELGEFWQQLLPKTKPAIAEFVSEVCRGLMIKDIQTPEQLVRILDKGLAEVGRWQSSTVAIATKSDTGPSRQRNEDACYPPSGSLISKPPHCWALTIVCDGIGGHEGGNVASNLAIETIQQQIQELTKIPYDHIDPILLLEDLQRAAAVANDKISQRNDNESRQGRQRMGTTFVLALPIAHEMYIAHVGDSRAYWIAPHGCYQVTLDDDVASREVRLGYAIYRDALQQGASGSLVQALGMSPSSSLHPSAERFIVDEDCVFLLCSDGLSDFDRVEQYWDTEILPLLEAKTDIKNVADRLIEIANTLNGHDNVTVALVHYQVKYSEPETKLQKVLPEVASIIPPATISLPKTQQITPEAERKQKTQVIPDTAPSKRPRVPLQLVILVIVILFGGFVGYLLRQGGFLGNKTFHFPSVPVPNQNPPSSLPAGASTNNNDLPRVIQVTAETSFKTVDSPPKTAIVPAGSVLRRIEQPIEQTNNKSWIYLQVCSVGEGVTSSSTNPYKKPLLKQGQTVRIQLSELKLLPYLSIPTAEVANRCLANNAGTTSSEGVLLPSSPTVKPEN